ncbi:MAG: ComEC/Rec2 family competence protein, partial [Gemmatimonadota bacterium]|nr:ComEC/Rec2 family competence protein [Gemmatimonadota bacterium]
MFPLVAAVLALGAGLLPGLRFGGPVPLLALGAAVVAAASLFRGRSARWGAPAILASFAMMGAALGADARRGAATDCRARFADDAGMQLRGVLAANLAPPDPDGRPRAVPVRLLDAVAEGRAVPGCGGEVTVRFPQGVAGAVAGSEVRVRGRWASGSGPVLPSGWPRDPRFSGSLRADTADVAASAGLRGHPLLTLRGRASAHLDRLFPLHAPLANALLLGRRETLDPAIRDRWARAGMIHLLAISGTHVGLLAGVVLLLGRGFMRRRTLAWATMALLALYLALIGAPPSAVRAGVMISLALLGAVLQRPSSPFPLIAAAAGALLVWDPSALLQPGFQLSFAGVLGILLLRRTLMRWLPRPWRAGGWRRWLADSLTVSAAAFVFTSPFTIHHFGQTAPAGLLANVPALPLT